MKINRELLAAAVTYRFECLPEDMPIPGNAFVGDSPEAVKRCEENIRAELAYGNEWAWCLVRCVATFGPFEGDDYLGCCSYENEADFMQGGYADDMKEEALSRLIEVLESASVELAKVSAE